ncbi:hypothetical protein NKJ03_29955, partial [Mesorhizobium sp. M0228]
MDEARISRHGWRARLWLAGGWLLIALLAAIFAPLVAPQDPLAQDLMLERLPPFWLSGGAPPYVCPHPNPPPPLFCTCFLGSSHPIEGRPHARRSR